MCVSAHFSLPLPKFETFKRPLKTEPTGLFMMIELLSGLKNIITRFGRACLRFSLTPKVTRRTSPGLTSEPFLNTRSTNNSKAKKSFFRVQAMRQIRSLYLFFKIPFLCTFMHFSESCIIINCMLHISQPFSEPFNFFCNPQYFRTQ